MFLKITTLEELESACQQLYVLYYEPYKSHYKPEVAVTDKDIKSKNMNLRKVEDLENDTSNDIILCRATVNKDSPDDFESQTIYNGKTIKDTISKFILEEKYPVVAFFSDKPFNTQNVTQYRYRYHKQLESLKEPITAIYCGPISLKTDNPTLEGPSEGFLVACINSKKKKNNIIREQYLVKSNNQFYYLLNNHPPFIKDIQSFVLGNPMGYSADKIMDIIEESVSPTSTSKEDIEIYDKIHKEIFSTEEPPKSPPLTVFSSQTLYSRGNKRVQQVINLIPDDFKPKSLLDIGCADGSITNQLRESLDINIDKCHGCDIKPLTKPIGFSFQLIQNCKLEHWEDQSKSLVTAFMVLHHVSVPLEMIKEVYRVLEPGGYFIIREHSVQKNPEAIFLDIVHGLYDQSWSNPKQDPEFLQNHWAQYYSRDQWDVMICSVGFQRAKYYTAYKHILRYFYTAYQKPMPRKRSHSTNDDMIKKKDSSEDLRTTKYSRPHDDEKSPIRRLKSGGRSHRNLRDEDSPEEIRRNKYPRPHDDKSPVRDLKSGGRSHRNLRDDYKNEDSAEDIRRNKYPKPHDEKSPVRDLKSSRSHRNLRDDYKNEDSADIPANSHSKRPKKH